MASLHLRPTNLPKPSEGGTKSPAPPGDGSRGQLTCAPAPRDPVTRGRGLTCPVHADLLRDRGGCSGQSPTAQQADEPLPPPSPRTKGELNRGRAPGRQERALTCPWPHPRPTQVNRDTHSSALSTLMAPDRIRPRPRSPATAASSRSATSERPQPRPPARPRAPPRPAPPPRRQAPPRTRDRLAAPSQASRAAILVPGSVRAPALPLGVSLRQPCASGLTLLFRGGAEGE